jgi:hypothetical protein
MGEHQGDSRNPGPAIALVNTSRLVVTNETQASSECAFRKFHSFLSITINSLITQQCQRRAWHNGRSPARAGSFYR